MDFLIFKHPLAKFFKVLNDLTEQNQAAGLANVGIQQLNLSYSPEQDRLLFRVGLHDNSELQVWLTFRVTRQIWQLLSGRTAFPTANSIQQDAAPQQALEQFQQEAEAVEALQKMDFSSAYQPREKVQNDGPMLAVKASLNDANPVAPVLILSFIEGIAVNMNLNKEMVLAICNMLQMAAKDAGWSIGAPAQEPVSMRLAEGAEPKKVLH